MSNLSNIYMILIFCYHIRVSFGYSDVSWMILFVNLLKLLHELFRKYIFPCSSYYAESSKYKWKANQSYSYYHISILLWKTEGFTWRMWMIFYMSLIKSFEMMYSIMLQHIYFYFFILIIIIISKRIHTNCLNLIYLIN